MAKPKKRCAYCGEIAQTVDHVPPKSFFPKPRPKNLLTVPSCFSCNNSPAKDEEYFLATLMFGQAGDSEIGQKLWNEKLHRMYKKNKGLRKVIARNFQTVELASAQGIFLGQRLAIQADNKRINSVVEKIVGGLYFFEYKQPIPARHKFSSLLLQSEDNYNAANQFLGITKDGTKSWPGVFQYKHHRDNHMESIWFLRFWDCAAFWVMSHREKLFSGTDHKSKYQLSSIDR